jgi:uncharacterized membrane protein YphA (DoxX/SURF4 family)
VLDSAPTREALAYPGNDTGTRRWTIPQAVAFRFCFIYFGLFIAGTQILIGLIPTTADLPNGYTLWPMLQITEWTAAHIFQIPGSIHPDSRSGDTMFDWVFVAWVFFVALIGTAAWSLLDRRRANYDTLYACFRLFVRFALASQLIYYGFSKVLPTQMPFPRLTKMLQPFGSLSPMGVLWNAIGASPAYETFAGTVETLAGLLLIIPRTATLGALIATAAMTHVFVLNMTYDVPVKILSFHLLLLALFLLAPDATRLLNIFFLNRPVGPSNEFKPFATRRSNRILLVAQVLFGSVIIGVDAAAVSAAWNDYGGGGAKSPLYGIWNVQELRVNGMRLEPLLSKPARWRRVVFDRATSVSFQRMDDTFTTFPCKIDMNMKTITLSRYDDKSWTAPFVFNHPRPNVLVMDGRMFGRKFHIVTRAADPSTFLINTRGFHWIQEQPFNR